MKRLRMLALLAMVGVSAQQAQTLPRSADRRVKPNGAPDKPSPAAVPSVAGFVNGASYVAPVAPGSIAAVFGTFNIGSLLTASGAPLPTNLSGLTLQPGTGPLFPFFYVAASQLGVQVPWELSGSQATVTATTTGQAGAPFPVKLAPFAPGIFSTNAQGTGQGAVIDANYRLVDSSNPATVSTVLQIYCTGLGPVTNQPATGAASPSSPLAATITAPTVTVGGLLAACG